MNPLGVWIFHLFIRLVGLDYYFYSIVALPYGGVIVCSVFFCTINILLGAFKCTCQGDVGAAAEARQKFAAPPPPAKQTERELLLSCHRFTTKLLPLEKYFHSISPRLSLALLIFYIIRRSKILRWKKSWAE